METIRKLLKNKKCQKGLIYEAPRYQTSWVTLQTFDLFLKKQKKTGDSPRISKNLKGLYFCKKKAYNGYTDWHPASLAETKENIMRKIYEIADDISNNWQKVYFGAVPYLAAMKTLSSINDKYMYDDGRSIVNYFLSNAGTWKGDHARNVKKELNAMLKLKS